MSLRSIGIPETFSHIDRREESGLDCYLFPYRYYQSVISWNAFCIYSTQSRFRIHNFSSSLFFNERIEVKFKITNPKTNLGRV